MNECILYYDGLNHYNGSLFASKSTLKTILLAKEEYEKRNDRHIVQFKLVPKENISRYRYHRNPRCFKFTERIRQKQADSMA